MTALHRHRLVGPEHGATVHPFMPYHGRGPLPAVAAGDCVNEQGSEPYELAPGTLFLWTVRIRLLRATYAPEMRETSASWENEAEHLVRSLRWPSEREVRP